MRKYLAAAFSLAILISLVTPLQAQGGTTTTRSWNVDSFFDITYRIDAAPTNSTGTAVTRETGPTTLPDGSLLFDTEMLQLTLTGVSPLGGTRIMSGANFGMPSPGQTVVHGDPDFDYHVDSFFDVFVEIELPGSGPLRNLDAARFHGTSDSFFDITYRLDAPVTLYDAQGAPAGSLNAGSTMRLSPEPSGLLALAGGLVPLGFAIRRRIRG